MKMSIQKKRSKKTKMKKRRLKRTKVSYHEMSRLLQKMLSGVIEDMVNQFYCSMVIT